MRPPIGGNKFHHGTAAVSSLAGFGISTAILALASLAAIPAMVRADGPDAWGAIAFGQAIGAISSIVVGYGWAVSGPSRIARADASARLREFADSLRVKLALLLPVATVAATAAGLASRHNAVFAAAGALSATAVALSSGWYFAGLMKPYTLIMLETVPRVTGTAIGITLMTHGYSAIAGLVCTTAGMLTGLAAVTAWVYRSSSRSGAVNLPKVGLGSLLKARRDGVLSIVGAPVFFAAPLAIVSLVAPQSLPVFALADKARQLVSSGLGPLVTFLQGWVPRGNGQAVLRRGRSAMVFTTAAGLVLCLISVPLGPILMHWMGAGKVAVPAGAVILTALNIAIDLLNSVLAYSVIAALGGLRIVSRATVVSLALMVPTVYLGTQHFGVIGALAGTLFGLVTRVSIEVVGLLILVGAPRSRRNAGAPWAR